MASKKFSRAANFSNCEEELLVALVKKRKNVIECKVTDGTTIRDKNTAWECVGREFNANSGGQFRAIEILRRKYENIKKRTKHKYADEKIKILGTGGGPYNEIPISQIDMEVKEILGTSLTGLESKYDDDAAFGNYIV